MTLLWQMFGTAIAIIFCLVAAVQIFYCLYFFSRIFSLRERKQDNLQDSRGGEVAAKLPVSVIICAKNEARNLAENLPYVLEQEYLNADGGNAYEVIVVNDQSTDDTETVLSELLTRCEHLRVVTLPVGIAKEFPGKKNALNHAALAAAYEHILMTDADCKPASRHWIALMVQPFNKGKEIVAGYGGYYKQKGLLNKFIRCETIHTFLQYKSYNMAGYPYMAVGRNLACRKELVLAASKDPKWVTTVSGDDDLLIQLGASSSNMTVVSDHGAHTYSVAKGTFKEWMRQKQRHLSTGKLYRPSMKMIAGAYGLSHALSWVCIVTWLILNVLGCMVPYYPLILLVGGHILLWIMLIKMSNMIGERSLEFFWPLFDFGWMIYNLFFAPYILWKKKQEWK